MRQGHDGGSLQDQQEQLLRQLSEEVKFHFYRTDQGFHVTTVGPVRVLLNGGRLHTLEFDESRGGFSVTVLSVSRDRIRIGIKALPKYYSTTKKSTTPSFVRTS